MGDYNADLSPDTGKMRMVGYGLGFLPDSFHQSDQFSTPTDLKVYHFVKQINGGRIHVLVDPAEIPGI